MMVGAARRPDRSTATRCSPKLVDIQYERNDVDFARGKFRVRGDCVEIWPSLRRVRLPHRVLGRRDRAALDHQSDERRSRSTSSNRCSSIRPSTSCCRRSAIHSAVDAIRKELDERLEQFRNAGQAARSAAAQRPHAVRHRDDDGSGLLPGHRELQPAAERPRRRASRRTRCSTSFPKTSCCSSTSRTSPSRRSAPCTPATAAAKTTLVEHGFRLPSALDNRPLKFDEWRERSQPGRLRLGDARPVRAGADRRRSRRAGHSPDRPARSGDRSRPGPRPGAAFAGADSRAGGRRRARAGDDAHQAAGRRSVRTTSASKASAASGCTASSMPSSASSCCATCGKGSSKRSSA